MTDLIDLEPSEDDLVDEVIEDEPESADIEDDFDYAAIDDRWNNDGVPSWSAWA